ncbi:cysteine desulfurase-like protein [Caenispirillum salinarum]|uniref:cysteine desulfurase-like protein n=1 Tax=Caenispirillum salinarum TaxID=859058 RepID=UPI0038509462
MRHTTTARGLDIDALRREFPALSQDFVFLDNAGGSAVLKRVADRVADYLLTTSVQLGASYRPSAEAAEKVAAAQAAVARLLNAPHPDEVVMGGSTTLLLHLLGEALEPSVRPGDEIIVTDVDHEANVGPWRRLERAGAIIREWRVNRDTMDLEMEDLEALLSDRTTWVAVTHCSNILGTVVPVAEVARRVHAAGARLCVDGVGYAPHRLVDVQASGADVYALSFYKTFGPHYAVMWAGRDLLDALPGLNHYFITDAPGKLQPGSVNYELVHGCGGIADYLTDTGRALGAAGDDRALMAAAFDAFTAHEDRLSERLLSYLRGRPDVRILGRPRVGNGDRVPTISFTVGNRTSEDIVRRVDRHGIGIRFGDFYAKRLIPALGADRNGGVVRVSMAHYNTAGEIDRLISALDDAMK